MADATAICESVWANTGQNRAVDPEPAEAVKRAARQPGPFRTGRRP